MAQRGSVGRPGGGPDCVWAAELRAIGSGVPQPQQSGLLSSLLDSARSPC